MSRKPNAQQTMSLLADLLAVIPRHASGVEVKASPEGDYHLRKQYPNGSGVMAFLRQRLGWKHECYYNLDARGTTFWKLLDGNRTLQEIASIVSIQWEVDESEGRHATMQYIRGLMLRNLVELKVPEDAIERDRHDN